MSAYETNTKGFNEEGQKTDKMYFYIKSSRSKNKSNLYSYQISSS